MHLNVDSKIWPSYHVGKALWVTGLYQIIVENFMTDVMTINKSFSLYGPWLWYSAELFFDFFPERKIKLGGHKLHISEEFQNNVHVHLISLAITSLKEAILEFIYRHYRCLKQHNDFIKRYICLHITFCNIFGSFPFWCHHC